ncbi:hypothetical protein GQ600_17251 [Phytophthora cactorum]|nr:hypothetical protein GQ600_17251 [Phytophthora cactorum]
MILNAHTEAEYDTARKYMYSIVEGKQITLEQEPESKHAFLKYFDANWHQCRRICAEIHDDAGECVDTLILLQSIAEIKYAKRITDVGHMGYRGADAELERLVREWYRAANDRSTFYTIRDVQWNVLELTSSVDSTRVYHIDTKIRKFKGLFIEETY